MKFIIPLFALIFVLAACQPSAQPTEVLPTLAVLPGGGTATTSIEPQTTEVTAETTEGLTIEPSVTSGEAVVKPTDTPTMTPTLEPTQAAIGTATEAALEAPVYATFTAAPAGTLPSASNFNQVADVLINEKQFQEELNAALPSKPGIQSAVVDFVPGSIVVKMTTSGFTPIIGTVTIPVTLQNDLASITISGITTEPMPASQSYIDLATGDLFVLMVDTLDKIVKSRIGVNQKLKSIAVTDTSINVTMLVP
jgi:hypothetical protein